ncbi:MAG: hypothetical protein WBW05_22380, partial [Candidatus Acidiferrum sp.]
MEPRTRQKVPLAYRGERKLLPSHLSLHEPAQEIEFVYFPNRGMVSQVVVTKDGRTVEVGVVGSEGYVGAGLAAGLSRSSV